MGHRSGDRSRRSGQAKARIYWLLLAFATGPLSHQTRKARDVEIIRRSFFSVLAIAAQIDVVHLLRDRRQLSLLFGLLAVLCVTENGYAIALDRILLNRRVVRPPPRTPHPFPPH